MHMFHKLNYIHFNYCQRGSGCVSELKFDCQREDGCAIKVIYPLIDATFLCLYIAHFSVNTNGNCNRISDIDCIASKLRNIKRCTCMSLLVRKKT